MIQYTKGRCCYDTKEKLAMIKKVLGNNIGRKVSLTIRRSKEEYVEVETDEHKKRTVSYSYFDVLTSQVSLKAS